MPTGALHRLKNRALRLPDSDSDIRGHRVIDSAGQELGKVEDLLVDDREEAIRFIEVEVGGHPGLVRERCLLPVEAIGEIHSDVLRVNHSRQRVTGAPKYDPDQVEQQNLSHLYWYYGYRSPLWNALYAD